MCGVITSKRSHITPAPTRSQWEHLYGRAGEVLRGSRYIRGYCESCGEPYRRETSLVPVKEGQGAIDGEEIIYLQGKAYYKHHGSSLCWKCDPYHKAPAGEYGPTDDTSPSWDNAVRQIEDRG